MNMKVTMNNKLHDMALQIGGSHYPGVAGQYFVDTVNMTVDQCLQVITDNPDATADELAALIKQNFQ